MRLVQYGIMLWMWVCISSCGGGGGGGGTVATTGSIRVVLTGLPDGALADVSLTAPGGATQPVQTTQTISNLSPGNYALAANAMMVANIQYLPQPTSQTISVVAGGHIEAVVRFQAANSLTLSLRKAMEGLDRPVYLTAPAGDSRLFIVEQGGLIRIIKNGVLLGVPFLDIQASVTSGGERGLLSMAFDPDFANTGQFYVYFTDLQGDIAIERYQVARDNADLAEIGSALRILSIKRDPAFTNHNGGLVLFGADGMLYVGTGDGGGAGDPAGHGQKLDTLLGKLLRIDVRNATVAEPYAIPPDNPFTLQAGKSPEIWAYGLRNPWRFAIDTADQLIFIADVGQHEREEVNVVTEGAAGLNYGWNITEGTRCYPNGDSCNTADQTLPVLEYDHGQGCSITGGLVYRGSKIPALQGHYFYSDFCRGWLKSFAYRDGVVEQITWPVENVGNIVSFGQDGQQELYVLSSKGGAIYQIVAN
ncbi:hypothetical protein HNQ59_003669 [Chitinivorax tropicus]|uniref:Glucose/Sorbosone dehydrogenase domain-containing protein n=1 Tax=Chitinivorax tropicus TaxID=714531 RepID=A0A840MPH7_9PROT|nr:PQQ-dependent sugar dehydrogenase [Chitinivorax tropicus]MBB5020350.1 hypothetical protein [Chitinivorax tropicus]